jgi:predicted PurR-regulated permease PerM
MVTIELNHLAKDLPRYETNLNEKIRNFRDAVGRAGLLTNASNLLKDVDRDLKDQNEAPVTKSSLADGAKGKTPVEVHQSDPAASETLVAMLRPLVTPFTTTGIVVIFLIFFLFQREDLRNRFIRLNRRSGAYHGRT